MGPSLRCQVFNLYITRQNDSASKPEIVATNIKIIRSIDYLYINDDGSINFERSKKRLSEIASEKCPTINYEILLDFRRTQWILSTEEIYSFVHVFTENQDSFGNKIALLLLPGVNFDKELFHGLCTEAETEIIHTFTNYEDAIHWFYDRS